MKDNPVKLLIGPIFLLVGAWFLLPNILTYFIGEDVTGVVKEIKIEKYKENTGNSYTLFKPVIEFRSDSGEKFFYIDKSGTKKRNKWAIGQKVPLAYLQLNPSINIIKSWEEILLPWIFLFLLGGGLTVYTFIPNRKTNYSNSF